MNEFQQLVVEQLEEAYKIEEIGEQIKKLEEKLLHNQIDNRQEIEKQLKDYRVKLVMHHLQFEELTEKIIVSFQKSKSLYV